MSINIWLLLGIIFLECPKHLGLNKYSNAAIQLRRAVNLNKSKNIQVVSYVGCLPRMFVSNTEAFTSMSKFTVSWRSVATRWNSVWFPNIWDNEKRMELNSFRKQNVYIYEYIHKHICKQIHTSKVSRASIRVSEKLWY